MPDSFTSWHRTAETARNRQDAAASLEEAAAIVRESGGLTSAGHQVYLYASLGGVQDRVAAIDAWAAEHHVEASAVPCLGYAAKVSLGSVSVWAVALPVRDDRPAVREMEGAAA